MNSCGDGWWRCSKLLDEGMAGDNVGLLLRGVGREEVESAAWWLPNRSITPHTKFEGEVYVLTREEGGAAQCVFQWVPTAVSSSGRWMWTGTVTLKERNEMVLRR